MHEVVHIFRCMPQAFLYLGNELIPAGNEKAPQLYVTGPQPPGSQCRASATVHPNDKTHVQRIVPESEYHLELDTC